MENAPHPTGWRNPTVIAAIIGAVGLIIVAIIGLIPEPRQREPPPPTVEITSPESQASSVNDFKSDATGAAYLRVLGTSENVFSDNSLRIYVFVHSVKPPVDRGWWFQGYAEPNQRNEWEVPKVWFGSKSHPVVQGNVYDIQAVVAKSGLLESLKKMPYVESLKSLEPLSLSEIRVTVGAVSRSE
jgi:hypothetical protein